MSTKDMKDIEFNLLEEGWVRVIDGSFHTEELSLTDAILKSHLYADLNGELQTQNAAILRLMLAVLHTVFSRTTPDGSPAPIRNENDALDRWEALWKKGHFPEKPVRDYLASWRDRFWLFHPERPFFQVPEAKIGTEYASSKLNGALSESSNKVRLFPPRAGDGKNELTYPEAARWLLYVNAFDDTSAKPKTKDGDKKLPSPGAGWLGKLGMIMAKGNTLFETLMLNLILRRDGADAWGAEKPVWELAQARTKERVEIAPPDNLSELYTLQSRRLLLVRSGKSVTGYKLLGGDFFSPENAFGEQMTLWKVKGGANAKDRTLLVPARHDPSVQLWREFPEVFLGMSEHRHKPGVVSWVAMLKDAEAGLGRNSMVSFTTASVQYGDKDFFVTDVLSDSISFHSDLLAEDGSALQKRVSEEIAMCEKLATCTGIFASNLEKAAGVEHGDYAKAKEELYFRLDMPFRAWLAYLSPEDDADVKCEEWHHTALAIAGQLGREMFGNAGSAAFSGRVVKDEKKNTEYLYAAPQAYNRFRRDIRKVYQ